MTSFTNERIQSFFKGRFPLLEADEALLENAYTPPAYRGKGVMSSAMARIAELATDRGVRHVMTFIHQDNVPSLKGCAKAGFRPYLMRKDDHACFHLIRRRSFEQLPRGFELPM
jgi:RimJ/RimL family protein N-acetyltransferase